MTSSAIRETIRLLPPDSSAYRIESDPKRRRPIPADERWATGMNAPDWRWRIAANYFQSQQPLPPTIQDPSIRRAYYYRRGAPDENMAITHSLLRSANCNQRFVLQGFLCARDITLDGIASVLGLHREIVELYEALFFSVRSRDALFLSSLLFPTTRILAVKDAETGPQLTDLLLMRVGRDDGWKEVARLAGILPIEDSDYSTDKQIEQLEAHIAGNARMLARAGYLNKLNSAGLQYARPLIAVREKKEPEKPWDQRDHLSEMSISTCIQESFNRIMYPQRDRMLALQRGMDAQNARKGPDNGAPRRDRTHRNECSP